MEYSDFKKLVDGLRMRGKETEWIEFKQLSYGVKNH